MELSTFGEYLRYLRTSRIPMMTQEELAKAVGRGKMTISQFEQGKNAPPQGDLLNKLIVALTLTEDEECNLRYLAALSRNTLPSDIADYFFTNPSICSTIRAAKRSGYSEEDWKRIESYLTHIK